jgi:hypothetical protein
VAAPRDKRHEREAHPDFDAWVVADYDLARAERTVAMSPKV